MYGPFNRLFLAAGLLACLPSACSSGITTASRSNSSSESPAPQQDDAQIDRQAAGGMPNVLAGVNLVTYANVAPDCVDTFTGKQLTGFSCYSAAKTNNVFTRSKNLEANLVLSWELPSSLNGITSCPGAIDRVTEIHCSYSSSPAPTKPFKISLKVTKGSQSKNVLSGNIAQPAGSGPGGGNGDISSATSLVIYLAGKVRGDAGIDAFNSLCQLAIDAQPEKSSTLAISHGRVLLKGWESQFSLNQNPLLFTIHPLSQIEVERASLGATLSEFTNAALDSHEPVNYGLDTYSSRAGEFVWTGMGDTPMYGFDCGNWSQGTASGTSALLGPTDGRRLRMQNGACGESNYIYCLGWQ